jgi:hypothetical protein
MQHLQEVYLTRLGWQSPPRLCSPREARSVWYGEEYRISPNLPTLSNPVLVSYHTEHRGFLFCTAIVFALALAHLPLGHDAYRVGGNVNGNIFA